MAGEESVIRGAVSSILDGQPVDWVEAERSASDPERALLHHLQVVAMIAEQARSGIEGAVPERTPGARYVLLDRLGEGGMGVVWRAEDVVLGREVAIKILPQELASQREFRTRFLREARIAAALSHPNICTIHEIGETAEEITPAAVDSLFIVMEIVEGRTLQSALAELGPLPPGALLDLAIQIADGLGAAHRKRIVHRDLKPGNIMVTPEGRVKVLDFGLARPVASTLAEDSGAPSTAGPAFHRTRPGQVAGTVAYMSPEQAQGLPLDLRSDVFSFGTVLYEMAAARNPFAAGSQAATIDEIVRHDPEPLGNVRSDLPPDLGAIVTKCLRKEPENRFPDAEELLLRLRELQRTSSVSTSVPPVVRGGRWPLVLGLVMALALTGILVTRKNSLMSHSTIERTFVDDFEKVPDPGGGSGYVLFNHDSGLWNPSVRPGFLTLWTHRGDTWTKAGEEMPVRNLVAYPWSAKSFRATTRIVDFWPRKSWQQAGLLVFADQENYVRLTVVSSPRSTPDGPLQLDQVDMVVERDGEVLQRADNHVAADPGFPDVPLRSDAGPVKEIWLRITRNGDHWSFHFGYDGTYFAQLAEATLHLEPRYVGLGAFHGVSDANRSPLNWDPIPASFDLLEIEPVPGT